MLSSRRHIEPWQRNQYVITRAAFSAPLWGLLADRWSYKRMVQRAQLIMIVVLCGSAIVQNVEQLFVLRVSLGLLGGFGAMSMALITSITPREQTGQAIGLMQGARAMSAAIGPILGGVFADRVGIRPSFFASAAMGLLSFILVSIVFHEDVHTIARKRAEGRKVSLRQMIRAPAFLAVALVLFMVQSIDNSFGPVLPLFVTKLEGSEADVATWTGLIISAAAVATAISSTSLGRFATQRHPRSLLLFTLLGGAMICVPLALSQTTAQFMLWRVLLGLLAGGSITLAYTQGGMFIPNERRGSGFGMLTSATLIGSALGPLVAGAIAGIDLRWVFGVDALVYAAIFGWVLFALRGSTTGISRHVVK